MGEFLACGKPCLANGGVGDVAEDIGETGVGIALEPLGTDTVDLAGLDAALEALFEMAADPRIGLVVNGDTVVDLQTRSRASSARARQRGG